MTVKELIEELQSIDKKHHDAEVEICSLGSADCYTIDSVDEEPSFDSEDDDYEVIYINIAWMQKGKQMSCLHNEEVRESIKDELEEMSMNDFSNLVEKHDLGVDIIDDIFYQLVEKIMEERAV